MGIGRTQVRLRRAGHVSTLSDSTPLVGEGWPAAGITGSRAKRQELFCPPSQNPVDRGQGAPRGDKRSGGGQGEFTAMPQETMMIVGAVIGVFSFFAVVLAFSDMTWNRTRR